MKISLNQLRDYINLPKEWEIIHDIFDDIGIEVKKTEQIDDDIVFTLELLANRGDHYCYQGIAREIHGRTNWKLTDIDILDAFEDNNSVVKITSDDCFAYTLTEFVKSNNAETSNLNQNQLRTIELSGSNTILPPVDVTNFVNAEIGQPMHVFDADKVEGQICVRETKAGEKAFPLFTDDYIELPESTLVIADATKILAIAGIMGCNESKPTESTKRVFLESALFDPIKIRKTAKLLKLQTLSSMRFERGGDPELVVGAVKRANMLFQKIGWELNGKINIIKTWNYKPTQISINISQINNFFETSFEQEFVKDILLRYNYEIIHDPNKVNIEIKVPSYRFWDVKDEKDIFEEIARGVGYNSLPSSLPPNISFIEQPAVHRRKYIVENLLIGEGFYEVFTDGFYSESHRSSVGIDNQHPLWEHIRTVNSGDKAYSLLKNNSFIQAIELVKTNINLNNRNVKAFEWTRTFHPSINSQNGYCEEKHILWAIVSGEARSKNWNEKGKDVDVYYLKGLIEELSNQLSIPFEVKQEEADEDILPIGTFLHPKRRGNIICNGKKIGVLGEVHPNVLSLFKIKNNKPCFIEISQEILDIPPSERIYVPPTNNQPVVRDICLLLPHGVSSIEIVNYMHSKLTWLERINISDLYTSTELVGKNAITFSLFFSLKKSGKTHFTEDVINNTVEDITKSVLHHFKKFEIERR